MIFQSIPVALAIMYLLLIPCVVLYLRFKFGKREFLATVTKGLSAWIILAGALFAAQGTELSMFSTLIIAGLAMGMAGDIALSLPTPGFTSGMLFFGLGHICYIIAMILISGSVIYAVFVFILLYSVYLLVYHKLGIVPPENLRVPIIAYSIIIVCMLSLALTMPFTGPSGGLLLLFSGTLFTASDIMLALYNNSITKTETPGKKSENLLGIASLVCYFTAQSLFAVSVYLF